MAFSLLKRWSKRKSADEWEEPFEQEKKHKVNLEEESVPTVPIPQQTKDETRFIDDRRVLYGLRRSEDTCNGPINQEPWFCQEKKSNDIRNQSGLRYCCKCGQSRESDLSGPEKYPKTIQYSTPYSKKPDALRILQNTISNKPAAESSSSSSSPTDADKKKDNRMDKLEECIHVLLNEVKMISSRQVVDGPSTRRKSHDPPESSGKNEKPTHQEPERKRKPSVDAPEHKDMVVQDNKQRETESQVTLDDHVKEQPAEEATTTTTTPTTITEKKKEKKEKKKKEKKERKKKEKGEKKKRDYPVEVSTDSSNNDPEVKQSPPPPKKSCLTKIKSENKKPKSAYTDHKHLLEQASEMYKKMEEKQIRKSYPPECIPKGAFITATEIVKIEIGGGRWTTRKEVETTFDPALKDILFVSCWMNGIAIDFNEFKAFLGGEYQADDVDIKQSGKRTGNPWSQVVTALRKNNTIQKLDYIKLTGNLIHNMAYRPGVTDNPAKLETAMMTYFNKIRNTTTYFDERINTKGTLPLRRPASGSSVLKREEESEQTLNHTQLNPECDPFMLMKFMQMLQERAYDEEQTTSLYTDWARIVQMTMNGHNDHSWVNDIEKKYDCSFNSLRTGQEIRDHPENKAKLIDMAEKLVGVNMDPSAIPSETLVQKINAITKISKSQIQHIILSHFVDISSATEDLPHLSSETITKITSESPNGETVSSDVAYVIILAFWLDVLAPHLQTSSSSAAAAAAATVEPLADQDDGGKKKFVQNRDYTARPFLTPAIACAWYVCELDAANVTFNITAISEVKKIPQTTINKHQKVMEGWYPIFGKWIKEKRMVVNKKPQRFKEAIEICELEKSKKKKAKRKSITTTTREGEEKVEKKQQQQQQQQQQKQITEESNSVSLTPEATPTTTTTTDTKPTPITIPFRLPLPSPSPPLPMASPSPTSSPSGTPRSPF